MTIDHSSEFGLKHAMTSGKKTVNRCNRFTHRGQGRIGLDFSYDRVIEDHLLRLDWTQTHRDMHRWMDQKKYQSSSRKILIEAVAKTEIKRPTTLHTLRHSYATHLTNRGVNIQYLQEILGHNIPKTTMLYIHLSGKDIRNIKSPLDDMDL